jgi:hypothetical protein
MPPGRDGRGSVPRRGLQGWLKTLGLVNVKALWCKAQLDTS